MSVEAAGDGQVTAPVGTVSAGGNDSNTQPAEPTFLEVDDNTLIKPKGIDKPVKYGEHVRGLQAEYTKAAQRAAQFEKDLATERAQRQRYEEALRQRAAQQQSQPQQDPYEALRELPYLSGAEAAQVVQNIGNQIQARDKIILTLAQEIKAIKDTVGGLNSTYRTSEFDAKIKKWVADGGYPAEAEELAKDIYLAYEGDNLDEEFPALFKQRWEMIQRAIEAQKAAAVQASRRNVFVPGRGGNGRPSSPLQGLTGREDPREVANKLWEAMNSGSGT